MTRVWQLVPPDVLFTDIRGKPVRSGSRPTQGSAFRSSIPPRRGTITYEAILRRSKGSCQDLAKPAFSDIWIRREYTLGMVDLSLFALRLIKRSTGPYYDRFSIPEEFFRNR
jgi:hypothetical protein